MHSHKKIVFAALSATFLASSIPVYSYAGVVEGAKAVNPDKYTQESDNSSQSTDTSAVSGENPEQTPASSDNNQKFSDDPTKSSDSSSETSNPPNTAATGVNPDGSSQGGSNSENQGSSNSSNTSGMPKTITESNAPEGKTLDEIVASAGLDALGEGNTPPDSILGETPMFHYTLRNAANADIAHTASAFNNYLYSPDGFERMFIDHGGVGRYYLRVYTAGHGWFPWQNSKESTPNPNAGDKIQAIQLRVKGYTGIRDDIYYKVVLNDGTVLDWAKNGQTTGTIGTDKYIVAIKVALWYKENTFPEKTDTLMLAGQYEGPYNDENGTVHYTRVDGNPYTGWAYYNGKQYYFHEGNVVQGWQYISGYKYYFNEDGSVVKDLEPVMGLTGDYQIKFNKATKTFYVMAKDGANGYIIPYKTYMATCGPATPLGTYRVYAKYRWKLMHDTIYCQFLNRFYQGFIIHSLIYYDAPNSYRFSAPTYNYMDDAVSDGCIRLKAGEAAWIYYNTPGGIPVIIYSDQWNKGPVEKDSIDNPIPNSQNFDPTDPGVPKQ